MVDFPAPEEVQNGFKRIDEAKKIVESPEFEKFRKRYMAALELEHKENRWKPGAFHKTDPAGEFDNLVRGIARDEIKGGITVKKLEEALNKKLENPLKKYDEQLAKEKENEDYWRAQKRNAYLRDPKNEKIRVTYGELIDELNNGYRLNKEQHPNGYDPFISADRLMDDIISGKQKPEVLKETLDAHRKFNHEDIDRQLQSSDAFNQLVDAIKTGDEGYRKRSEEEYRNAAYEEAAYILGKKKPGENPAKIVGYHAAKMKEELFIDGYEKANPEKRFSYLEGAILERLISESGFQSNVPFPAVLNVLPEELRSELWSNSRKLARDIVSRGLKSNSLEQFIDERIKTGGKEPAGSSQKKVSKPPENPDMAVVLKKYEHANPSTPEGYMASSAPATPNPAAGAGKDIGGRGNA